MKERLSQEQIEMLEHNNAVLAIRALLLLPQGKALFKYLFKEFEVGKLPPVGFPRELLEDKLGSLRAGQAIFELASEAEPEISGMLLAQIEKERYETAILASQNG